ncbi:hypothetical protein PN36_13410 [Candidatus Thiomargarita nelsonii]|uniref:PIN domain-containing protein n=1 Tax=Candidatus Thiomargarita nelsonii TaxID=1003181 RepID=A0A4E0QVP4_9GAMM|nr:hypothetical protein PN36_13410 [Candidatus Thiomargarita nelsonii]
MKYHRKKELNKRKLQKIIKDIERNTTTEETTIRPFQLVAMPVEIFSLTKDILLQQANTFAISSNDALHLAILQQIPSKVVMVTSDVSMQKVCERLSIPFYDPETS